jgi:ATP-binding cassette subfamily B protein
VFKRLLARNELKFFAVLPKADRTLAIVWWVVLVLRGVLPAVFAIAMGVLVAAVERGDRLADGLVLVGIVFVSKSSRRSTKRLAPTSATIRPPGYTTG